MGDGRIGCLHPIEWKRVVHKTRRKPNIAKRKFMYFIDKFRLQRKKNEKCENNNKNNSNNKVNNSHEM